MMKKLLKKVRLLKNDEGGAALILVTLALPMIFGLAAFCVDLGYAYYIGSRIQNASDIAALAGGTKLVQGDKEAVEAQALDFVKLNIPPGWDIFDSKGNLLSGTGKAAIKITPTIEAKCSPKLEAAGLPCYAAPGKIEKINYLDVSLGADAPLFFATGLGFRTASLQSDSIVTADGSTMPPLNVAIIIDSTVSMKTQQTTSCSGETLTKLECAKKAALGMLSTLWPVVDQVALYTFPGLSPSAPAGNANKNVCASGTPIVGNYYSGNANYQVIGFTSDYRDKGVPPVTKKNTSDPLVQALDRATCTGLKVGTTATGGGVYTYFADAIDQAQKDLDKANEALVALGQPPRQNVIVFLSDGDANASSSDTSKNTTGTPNGAPNQLELARQPNQCLQAIQKAAEATAKGTWVYSVAYNAVTKAGPQFNVDSCNYDTSVVENVTVTVKRYTTPYQKKWSNNKCPANFTKGTETSQTLSSTTMIKANAPAAGTGPTITTPVQGTCSKNSTSSYTTYYDVTTVVAAASTKTYDRSACTTMQSIASSPDKFFSIDTNCKSDANPNVTDLMSIFKKVAVSMMTKRRAPRSAI